MDALAWLWHVAGFLAPALVLAPAVVGAGWLFWGRRAKARVPPLGRQLLLNVLACVLTLLAGLALTGHDGRMLTYSALVLVSAGCQAWMLRRA